MRAYLTERDDGRRTPQADSMRVAAAQLALLKAREDHQIRRTVVFSRSIVQSEAFAETLPETAASIPGGHADSLWVASVHSRNRRSERLARLAQFAQPPRHQRDKRPADRNVLCNVRLCVEGVDFPLADSVLFADPKQSTIDIVQAIGRALRIGPTTNKVSTLIIPVLFGPGQRPEDATFGTPYHLLHQVMIALKAYDEHYFRRLPINGTLPLLPTPAFAIRPSRAPEIAPHLMLRIMDPEPDVWETGMACTQQFFDAHGHLNVPSNHITRDGFHLGCWLGYQRALKAAGSLAPGRAAALATCNMTWAHAKDSTEALLETAQAYARQNGHLVPGPTETHQGRPLGRWLIDQRCLADNGSLPTAYHRALKDIDPWWNPPWPEAWQRMCARARTRGADLAIPRSPLPADLDEVTAWLDKQFDDFPTLAKGQQAQLAALPLTHDPLALGLRRPFGRQNTEHSYGLRAARRFYREHQHLRVPANYVDEYSGTQFPLGQWLADLRTLAGASRLNREEIDSVEALAMEWLPGLRAQDTPADLPGAPAPVDEETHPGGSQGRQRERTSQRHRAAPPRHPDQNIWIAYGEPQPSGLVDVVLHGGRRVLLTMPSGGGKTMTTAVAVHEAASTSCLLLGPDRDYLHKVVKTWRMVRKGPLAGFNFHPTPISKTGVRLNSAGELADWMVRQPSGALVVARYHDAELIAHSHRDHRLPPWEHLVVEEAHRTAEGNVDPQHPYAAIHYDDGILAYKRLYLTATPRIPSELPDPARSHTISAWAVNMLAQPIFGSHQPTVERQELVDKRLLSPYQLIRVQVPEPTDSQTWRAQAIGAAHVIEQRNLRRVVAVLKDLKQAQEFANQLAVQMLDAEILVPPGGAVRYQHNQPVIRCQRATDPMPSDLDAVVLPADSYTTPEVVNALAPLMGQQTQRAAQTTIIVPEPIAPHDMPPTRQPAILHRIAAAMWAHDPAALGSSWLPRPRRNQE